MQRRTQSGKFKILSQTHDLWDKGIGRLITSSSTGHVFLTRFSFLREKKNNSFIRHVVSRDRNKKNLKFTLLHWREENEEYD